MRIGLVGWFIATITFSASNAFSQKLSWIASDQNSFDLLIEGVIQTGLDERVEREFKKGPPGSSSCSEHPALEAFDGAPICTIRFNSSGGSLEQGLKLGSWIANKHISTLISQSDECFSACAWAFIAGQTQGANGSIGRSAFLEAGGKLGFHGYSFGDDTQKVELDTAISNTQVINGAIYSYAASLPFIDLGWVAQVLTVPKDSMYLVASSSDYQALSLSARFDKEEYQDRDQWGLNACANTLDSYADRLEGGGERLTEAHYHEYLLNAIVLKISPTSQLKQELRKLETWQLHQLSGLGYYPFKNTDFPEEAKTYRLERGSGFYADYCFWFGGTETTILSEGDGSIWLKEASVWPNLYPLSDVCNGLTINCENKNWAPYSQNGSYFYYPAILESDQSIDCSSLLKQIAYSEIEERHVDFGGKQFSVEIPIGGFTMGADPGFQSNFGVKLHFPGCPDFLAELRKIYFNGELLDFQDYEKRQISSSGAALNERYTPYSRKNNYFILNFIENDFDVFNIYFARDNQQYVFSVAEAISGIPENLRGTFTGTLVCSFTVNDKNLLTC